MEDQRDVLIKELWARLDDYRAEEKGKIQKSLDFAHKKLRFQQKLIWYVVTTLGAALLLVLRHKFW